MASSEFLPAIGANGVSNQVYGASETAIMDERGVGYLVGCVGGNARFGRIGLSGCKICAGRGNIGFVIGVCKG